MGLQNENRNRNRLWKSLWCTPMSKPHSLHKSRLCVVEHHRDGLIYLPTAILTGICSCYLSKKVKRGICLSIMIYGTDKEVHKLWPRNAYGSTEWFKTKLWCRDTKPKAPFSNRTKELGFINHPCQE